MRRAAAVLFDMDGLLVDSEPVWYDVEAAAVERLGGTWAPEHQAALIGGTIDVRAENVGFAAAPASDRRVRISIRDYGCGIPDDVVPRIFDPYFTTKPGGNGLGLATAYAIIAKHGGNISVESKPGVGTVRTR